MDTDVTNEINSAKEPESTAEVSEGKKVRLLCFCSLMALVGGKNWIKTTYLYLSRTLLLDIFAGT